MEGGGGRQDAAAAAGFSLGGLSAVENGPEGAYQARYAVSRAGRYELHIRLRASGEPMPSSPFSLVVHPGPAHAPTTELALEQVPIRSSAGRGDMIIVRALDWLHNPCNTGGAGCTATVVPADGIVRHSGGTATNPFGESLIDVTTMATPPRCRRLAPCV